MASERAGGGGGGCAPHRSVVFPPRKLPPPGGAGFASPPPIPPFPLPARLPSCTWLLLRRAVMGQARRWELSLPPRHDKKGG